MTALKAAVAALTAILTGVTQVLPLTEAQKGYVSVALTVLGTVGVYLARNAPAPAPQHAAGATLAVPPAPPVPPVVPPPAQ